MRALKKALNDTEKVLTRLQAQLAALDGALADPANAPADLRAMNVGELGRRRAAMASELEAAEAAWLEAGEALEAGQG